MYIQNVLIREFEVNCSVATHETEWRSPRGQLIYHICHTKIQCTCTMQKFMGLIILEITIFQRRNKIF